MVIKICGRELEGTIATRLTDSAWAGRESKAVTVGLTYQEAVELFTDGVIWSAAAPGEEGMIDTDMSDYAISGPITDNRNGTVTIRMGRYSREELMKMTLHEAPASHAQARTMRRIIEEAAQHIEDDQDALSAAALYPAWEELISAQATAGMRFRHGGKLYKVIQAHAFAVNWVPGEGTESLYARIDEAHAGTEDEPVPYDGNMTLTEGLYYMQDGNVYLCTRSTGNPVYSPLNDLVGLYVEAVSA